MKEQRLQDQEFDPKTQQIDAPPESLHHSFNDTIHNAMHDLRSPLGVIKPYVEFLRKVDDSEKQEAILSRMQKAVEKMEVVINRFVKYSDLVCEGIPETAEINFPEIFNEVHKDIAIKYAYIPYDVTVEDNLDGRTFPFSPKYLKIILKAFIENAILHRSPERDLEISISVSMINEDLLLEMKDNGEGFTHDFSFEEAFQPFPKFQNYDTHTETDLSSLRYVVQRNKGEIYGSSSEDGTAFIIKLKPYPVFQKSKEAKATHIKKKRSNGDRPNLIRVS